MTAASELARYGIAVRIVDKAPQRTDKSKALVLVRLDGYVACSAHDAGVIAEYLDRLVGSGKR